MILYARGERWLAFADARVRHVDPCPTLAMPAVIVWQPLDTVVGVASFEGKSEHAGVLIERRLRAEGAIEADTKVFVHHVERAGASYQALYSTASLGEWQRLQHWSRTQTQHCAWLPTTALAWSLVQTRTAVVLHAQNVFQFFGLGAGRIVQAQTLAFGTDDDSLVHAARMLGERIREVLRPNEVEPSARPSVRWVCTFATAHASPGERLMAAFRDASGLETTSDDVNLASDEGPARSALPALASKPPLRLLLNAPPDRLALTIDRHRLAMAAVAMGLSAVFLAVAGHKLVAARRLVEETRETQARADRAQATSTAARPSTDGRIPKEQMAFIDTLGRLQAGLDVADVLLALKTASGNDLRILSVRSEDVPPQKSSTVGATPRTAVVVDGVLQDQTTTSDSFALSSFIRSLAGSGYTAEPMDMRGAAAASSVSSRLFSYRLIPATTAVTASSSLAKEPRQ